MVATSADCPCRNAAPSGQTLAYVYGHADKHGIKEGGMLELMLHRGSVARDDSLKFAKLTEGGVSHALNLASHLFYGHCGDRNSG